MRRELWRWRDARSRAGRRAGPVGRGGEREESSSRAASVFGARGMRERDSLRWREEEAAEGAGAGDGMGAGGAACGASVEEGEGEGVSEWELSGVEGGPRMAGGFKCLWGSSLPST